MKWLVSLSPNERERESDGGAERVRGNTDVMTEDSCLAQSTGSYLDNSVYAAVKHGQDTQTCTHA